MRKFFCEHYTYYKYEISGNVSKVLNNERIRDDAYGRSQSILGPKSGSGVSSAEYKSYDKYCEFKINDYERTREHFLKVWNSDTKGVVNEKK